MGSWTIKIKGVGAHHNKPDLADGDAEKMAKDFVEELRQEGHSIEAATFTQTGHDPVDDLLSD